MSRDPYLYPGTDVLINRFGIKDAEQLEIAERVITAARMGQPLPELAAMTLQGYQTIHRHIFGDVYPWAGEFRTINLSKGNTEFCRGPFVEPNMRRVFGELGADKHLQGLDADIFAYRAAVYIDDLNQIHPFREGNGRVQRVFLEHLAHQAGHELDRMKIDAKLWMRGSIESLHKSRYETMTAVIRAAIAAAAAGG